MEQILSTTTKSEQNATYNSVIQQIMTVPQEYLEDISKYISYISFCAQTLGTNTSANTPNSGTSKYFGTMHIGDGLEIQKQMRNEWK